MDNILKDISIRKYISLRCESLCAELLENGLPLSSLVIAPKGTSRKRFGRDIEQVSLDKNDMRTYPSVVVDINRNGIYDLLPEGLFHQPTSKTSEETVADKVVSHRRLKAEESAARKFFQPFEQEFIYGTTQVELLEREIARSLMRGNASDDFNAIWEIPTDLPLDKKPILARLMPWVYFIKSDKEAIVGVLRLLLGRNVTLTETLTDADNGTSPVVPMGTLELGVNTVVGGKVSDPVLEWLFDLYDMEQADMPLYVPGQSHGRLLQYFVEVFVPLEVEVRFNYHLKECDSKDGFFILGYGSVLGMQEAIV
ncbi:MAG: hypothetical protein QM610_10095 [Chitinophagaceae bacterium]